MLARPPPAVARPALALVEAARAGVVREHPQHCLAVALRAKLVDGGAQQGRARPASPSLGRDVDAVQLAARFRVAARADRRPADDDSVPIGDEAGLAAG